MGATVGERNYVLMKYYLSRIATEQIRLTYNTLKPPLRTARIGPIPELKKLLCVKLIGRRGKQNIFLAGSRANVMGHG